MVRKSLVPYFPRAEGLEQEHFESVLYYGSLVASFFHEKRRVGIVEQIVEQMPWSKAFVWDVRALVCLRIHSYGRAIDNDLVFVHDFRSQFLVSDGLIVVPVPGYEKRFQSQLLQTVVNGFRRTARP